MLVIEFFTEVAWMWECVHVRIFMIPANTDKNWCLANYYDFLVFNILWMILQEGGFLTKGTWVWKCVNV